MKGRITIIFGKTGTGKTTLATEISKTENRVFIFDTQDEQFEGTIFYSFNDLCFYLKDNPQLKDFRFVCKFQDSIEYEYIFKLAWEIENCLVFVDEASLYINPRSQSKAFLKLVNFGRHRKVKILAVSRRTCELHTSLRAMTNTVISFKQTHINDLKIMEEIGLSDLDKLKDFEYKTVEL